MNKLTDADVAWGTVARGVRMTVCYEVHWVTEQGKHCVSFQDSPEENRECSELLRVLKMRPSVFLLQVRTISTEVIQHDKVSP